MGECKWRSFLDSWALFWWRGGGGDLIITLFALPSTKLRANGQLIYLGETLPLCLPVLNDDSLPLRKEFGAIGAKCSSLLYSSSLYNYDCMKNMN